MATVLGVGAPLEAAATWLLDPVFPASARGRGPEDSSIGERAAADRRARAASTPVDSPETLDLLARVVWLLAASTRSTPSARDALSLTELRSLLSEPASSLQRALAAGLRTKRLRRVGAHNTLRYVLNA
jgi:hypothetical protein